MAEFATRTPAAASAWLRTSRRCAGVAALLITLAGCGIKMPVGTSLGPPTRQAVRIDRRAWVAPVEVRDMDVPNREAVVEGFTTSLRDYIANAGCFTQVSSLRGTPTDVVKGRHERCQVTKSRRIEG